MKQFIQIFVMASALFVMIISLALIIDNPSKREFKRDLSHWFMVLGAMLWLAVV